MLSGGAFAVLQPARCLYITAVAAATAASPVLSSNSAAEMFSTSDMIAIPTSHT